MTKQYIDFMFMLIIIFIYTFLVAHIADKEFSDSYTLLDIIYIIILSILCTFSILIMQNI